MLAGRGYLDLLRFSSSLYCVTLRGTGSGRSDLHMRVCLVCVIVFVFGSSETLIPYTVIYDGSIARRPAPAEPPLQGRGPPTGVWGEQAARRDPPQGPGRSGPQQHTNQFFK